MKPIQIFKTIVKIITILPVIIAGVKSIVKAYKVQNIIEDDLDGIFK